MGGGILLLDSHSLFNLLSSQFSEHNWAKNRFEQSDIWTDKHLANLFIEWLKKQNYREISNICQFVKETKNSNYLTEALKIAFPSKMNVNSKKSQYMLKNCIESIFSKENTLVLEEYRHPDVIHLELDYFLPQYNIAFEYQVEKFH